jgi:molecular chaperone GrpE
MREAPDLHLSKWPFILGDLLLVGVAAFFATQAFQASLQWWQAGLVAVCVAAGAGLSILPFVLEYRAAARLAESQALTTVADQLGNLEKLARQISEATARWQGVQEAADKTTVSARGIVDRIEAEARSFTDFLQKSQDAERNHLRLEVEKLRRAEGDWLQAAVRILDHVFALYQGGVRSGQPALATQLGTFQNACRDVVRRVGLTPFVAAPEEPFDSQRHQVLEDQATPSAGAQVVETLATGYTFQGRLLRPALVRVAEGPKPEDQPSDGPEATPPESTMPETQ